MQVVFELYGDELNGALKKLILNIFDDLVSEIFGKYLHISDSIFTMLLAPDKKVILECFFQPEVICMCEKFQVYPTPATCFFAKRCHIFDKYVLAIFF